jgi:methylmalonyl-CoA/ethylmalonyl-CoA epimerase
MLDGFIFHHIGYVTCSIADTSAIYQSAGYQVGEIIEDTIQRAKICFLVKDNNPCIELIEPVDNNSSTNKILEKNSGTTPYHVCYEVDNVNETFNQMIEIGYTPLF